MDISSTLTRLLSEHNMTVYALAKKSGLTTAAVYQLKKGISKDVKLSSLIKIADVLEISLDEFRN